jgi:hypothetical protein
MRLHHTKNKGDLGVFAAKLDLTEKGFRLLLPLTEHEAFDLVAYRGDRFYRVQVKYRAAVRGVVIVPFASSWADRHGVHRVVMDKASVDVVCAYCPDTRRCYYIDPRRHGNSVALRLAPTRNKQSKRVLLADDFTEFPETP